MICQDSVPGLKLLRPVDPHWGVWLALDDAGGYRAVNIVEQSAFKESTLYFREFEALKKYVPVSLKHPGLVHILHVAQNTDDGYFYEVMEIADDEITGATINPETYSPRSLAKDLSRRGKLSVRECVSLGLALADALKSLHQNGFVHGDIEPSNILFVKGVPKLADIGFSGLVPGMVHGQRVTYGGTQGYIPPEGPGTPAADVYSLGKVVYEAATGLDRHQFPELPSSIVERGGGKEWSRLNSIILKACEPRIRKRYQSAAELWASLLDLQRKLQA